MEIYFNRFALVAFALALASHALIFTLSPNFEKPISSDSHVFTVNIFKQITPPAPVIEIPKEPLVSEPIEAKEAGIQNENEVKQEPAKQPVISTLESEKSKTISGPISVIDMRNFINQDAKGFVSNNEDVIEHLNQTFEPKLERQAAIKNNRSAQNQALLTGVGARTDENGKRTCYAVIYNFSSSLAEPNVVYKDCTPDKKFEFDLNAPNNGWAER